MQGKSHDCEKISRKVIHCGTLHVYAYLSTELQSLVDCWYISVSGVLFSPLIDIMQRAHTDESNENEQAVGLYATNFLICWQYNGTDSTNI